MEEKMEEVEDGNGRDATRRARRDETRRAVARHRLDGRLSSGETKSGMVQGKGGRRDVGGTARMVTGITIEPLTHRRNRTRRARTINHFAPWRGVGEEDGGKGDGDNAMVRRLIVGQVAYEQALQSITADSRRIELDRTLRTPSNPVLDKKGRVASILLQRRPQKSNEYAKIP
ncbi:hypothetical protein HZH68_003045 [Vespula germanica]|uniref:Uncharacterized protein n=1 Tax=Vespula germanica TaxID=30212 RepID=A0A834NNK3_VESGE|nr:hypothetical protein HZH68_003045 [Vespula germanica]